MNKKKMKMTKMPVVVVAVCFLALFSGALRGADASFAPDVVSADGALPNTCDRVPGGYTNKNCTWYETNKWWLPSVYEQNAMCVCSQTTSYNNNTLECVRRFVQVYTDQYFPAEMRQVMADKKAKDNAIQYQYFLQKYFTPLIYKVHVDAYNTCCCPHGPAPYFDWIGVVLAPLPCPFVWEGVLLAGSCHGTPGRW